MRSVGYLKNPFKTGGYAINTVVSIFLILGSVLAMIHTYKSDYGDYGGTAKIRGKEDVLDYIYRDAGKQPFSVLVFTPPVYTYPYEYLFEWYGKRKYGFVPEFKKSQLTYLLIETDFEKPWSYNGWLETVVKNGTTISTTKLLSGFIVQKRIFP
jgi:hypothetical protein